MPDPLYLFAHLPKTAGQSVRAHIVREMEGGPEASAAYDKADQQTAGHLEALVSKGHSLQLLYGHYVDRAVAEAFAPRPVRPVIVLRDPRHYLTSLFNHERKNDTSLRPGNPETEKAFWKFAKAQADRQARWMVAFWGGKGFDYANRLDKKALTAEARAQLAEFWCVGDQSDLNASLAPFFAALGVKRPLENRKNEAGKDYQALIALDEAKQQKLLEMNPVDNDLYSCFAGHDRQRA